MAAWIGLGGKYSLNLVQAGTYASQDYDTVHGWHTTYTTFVENTGGSDYMAHYFFAVSCGTHLYIKAWDNSSNGCMYVQRISDGVNTGVQCYGPKSDEESAEAIVERDELNHPYFADFGTVTFYGVGITDHGSYKAMSALPHDYNTMWQCDAINPCPPDFKSTELASVGSILNDPGDPPYDQYSVTWLNARPYFGMA